MDINDPELADLVFTGDWPRSATVLNIGGGLQMSSYRETDDGRWKPGGPNGIELLRALGQMWGESGTVVLLADSSDRSLRLVEYTGSMNTPFDTAVSRFRRLFGEHPEEHITDWYPVGSDSGHLYGLTARLREDDGRRWAITSDQPTTTGHVTLVPDVATEPATEEISVHHSEILCERETIPESIPGDMTGNLVGAWRMESAGSIEVDWPHDDFSDVGSVLGPWLDGDGEVPELSPVGFPIDLTIRPDGSFVELADGLGEARPFDAEGVLVQLGETFHGYVITENGRDFVMANDGNRDGVHRWDDPEIVEELVCLGDQLIRTQNVVVDGLYRIRVVMAYSPA